MNRKLTACCCLVLCCLMLCAYAGAETISLSGTVSAKDTYQVYAPAGGTVESVSALAGQTVQPGDVLMTLRTTKVYATEDGTVTGVFAQPGDDAEAVAERYGAVLYMESDSRYTISASTANAYDAAENKYVHVGEKVYLTSRADSDHVGEGFIQAVSGTSFTVEVTAGNLELSETCNIYRDAEKEASSRIGRGKISRMDPIAVTGTGSVVSVAVQDGDQVTRGQLLFETLTGACDGLSISGADICAEVAGIVGAVNAEEGGALEKDSLAAVIYPAGSMQIIAQVSETDLRSISVGDRVEIELNWNAGQAQTSEGVVSMISFLADTTDDEAVYDVYIDFTPDDDTRLGMSALITTLEEAEDVPAA